MIKHDFRFWLLQVPGWLLLAYLVYAQAIPAFDYQLGVDMGTQESARNITDVGVAFWRGFAIADVIIYIPLLFLGLFGLLRGAAYGKAAMIAALGITIYWPIVALSTVLVARGTEGWHLANEQDYFIALPIIIIWAAWALLDLAVSRR